MTLKQYCLNLPLDSRVRLCNALQDSIRAELPERRVFLQRTPGRGEHLLGLMAEVIGEPVDRHSHKARFAWARTMVAYQLTQEGYSVTDAGVQMGKDHATISNCNNRMRAALAYPGQYRDVIDIWKQFQDRLQYEIQRGTNQDIEPMGV